jgi:hypothetical protein
MLVGKSEGNRPLEIPTRRWEYNIKMDLSEVGWGRMAGFIWFSIGTSGVLL